MLNYGTRKFADLLNLRHVIHAHNYSTRKCDTLVTFECASIIECACITCRRHSDVMRGGGDGVEYHFQEFNEPYAPL